MAEQFVSDEFRSVAATCQDAVDQNKGRDDWKPPGTPSGTIYSCHFTGMGSGASTNKDTGDTSAYVRLTFSVMDGEYQGRTFDVVFSTRFAWAMNPLFLLASMVDNDPSHQTNRNLVEAAEALAKHVGKPIVNVISKTSVSKTNGQEYTNISFDRVTDVVTEAVA